MFVLLLSQGLCPHSDNLGAGLNSIAGQELRLKHLLRVPPSIVAIKSSEGNQVTMKAGELKQ